MTVEKSSSTKKTTKKNTDSVPSNEVKTEVIETPDLKSKEQIKIENLECEVAELTAGMVVLMNAVSKFAVLTGNGNHLKEFGLERWEPSKKDMNKHTG